MLLDVLQEIAEASIPAFTAATNLSLNDGLSTVLSVGKFEFQTTDRLSVIAPLLPELAEKGTTPLESSSSNITWSLASAAKNPLSDIQLSRLLEIIGPEKLISIWGLLLAEQRVVFVGGTSSIRRSAVLGALSILWPLPVTFSQFVAMDVLPSKLSAVITASDHRGFIVSLSCDLETAKTSVRSSGSQFNDAVFVDLDKGGAFTTVSSRGDEMAASAGILDIVGMSGNVLQQATEGLNRVRAGVAELMYGRESDAFVDAMGSRDPIAKAVMDLRAVLATRPGASTITSFTSELLRGNLTTQSRRMAVFQWELEVDALCRRVFAMLGVFFFGDLQCRNSSTPADRYGLISDDVSPSDTSPVDVSALVGGRQAMGASSDASSVLRIVYGTRWFSHFRKERDALNKIPPRLPPSSNTVTGVSPEVTIDCLFDAACIYLRVKQLPYSAVHSQAAVSAIASLYSLDSSPATVSALLHSKALYPLALKLTEGSMDDGAIWTGPWSPSLLVEAPAKTRATFLRIVRDSASTDVIARVFRVCRLRLLSAKITSSGFTGISTRRTLELIHLLLVYGPSYTFAYSILLIPLLHDILHPENVMTINAPSRVGLHSMQPTEMVAAASAAATAAAAAVTAAASAAVNSIVTEVDIECHTLAQEILVLLTESGRLSRRRTAVALSRVHGTLYDDWTMNRRLAPGHAPMICLRNDNNENLPLVSIPDFTSLHSRVSEPITVSYPLPKVYIGDSVSNNFTSASGGSSPFTPPTREIVQESRTGSLDSSTAPYDVVAAANASSAAELRYRVVDRDSRVVYDSRQLAAAYDLFLPIPASFTPPPVDPAATAKAGVDRLVNNLVDGLRFFD